MESSPLFCARALLSVGTARRSVPFARQAAVLLRVRSILASDAGAASFLSSRSGEVIHDFGQDREASPIAGCGTREKPIADFSAAVVQLYPTTVEPHEAAIVAFDELYQAALDSYSHSLRTAHKMFTALVGDREPDPTPARVSGRTLSLGENRAVHDGLVGPQFSQKSLPGFSASYTKRCAFLQESSRAR